MNHRIETLGSISEDVAFRGMFAARKEVFVDLLKWDLPVRGGQFEVDRFDDENARYLILTDGEGRHLGSARLLPTIRPHILDTLFSDLSERPIPRGNAVFEITRFCLDRHLCARERRTIRNRLVSALVEYALVHGIREYTGVAEMGWFQQILAFGWECMPLGLPLTRDGMMLGALTIRINADTPEKLAAAGVWHPSPIYNLAALEIAQIEG